MIVWIVLLAILLLIFAVPYGVDVSWDEGSLRLGVKAACFQIWLLPKKEKSPKQLARQQRRQERKKAKTARKATTKEQQAQHQTQRVKEKKPLDLPFLFALVKMGLRALRRVVRSFTIDYLKLHYVVATLDPYDTAIQYSYLSGALAAVPEIAGGAVKIRKSDVQLGMDFTQEKPVISARLVVSLQLYKLVLVAIAFAVEFFRWKKNHAVTDQPVNERMDNNGREQNQ